MPATIAIVGSPYQTMIAQWWGTPAKQQKYKIMYEMHIYHNI
jgi:hypothetical protein